MPKIDFCRDISVELYDNDNLCLFWVFHDPLLCHLRHRQNGNFFDLCVFGEYRYKSRWCFSVTYTLPSPGQNRR